MSEQNTEFSMLN